MYEPQTTKQEFNDRVEKLNKLESACVLTSSEVIKIIDSVVSHKLNQYEEEKQDLYKRSKFDLIIRVDKWKQELIDNKQWITETSLWLVQNYFYYCLIASNDYSVIGEDEIEKLDKISLLFKIFPDVVIIISKTINWKKKYVLPSYFTDPKVDDSDKFKLMKEVEHISLDAKTRYLYSMLTSDLIHEERNVSEIFRDSDYLNSRVFYNLSYQSRFGNIWGQIFTILTCSINESKDQRLFSTDFESTSLIGTLISQFDAIPFYANREGRIRLSPSVKPWNVSMMPLLYSLMEFAIDEFSYTVDEELAKIGVNMRLNACKISFETKMLEDKGKYDYLANYIISRQNSIASLISTENSQRKFATNNVNKVNIDIEETEKQHLETPIEFRKWVSININKMNKMNTEMKTDHIRWMLSAVHSMVNPGIYFKTAIALDAEKSIEARSNGATFGVDGLYQAELFPGLWCWVELDWANAKPYWQEFRRRYINRLHKYKEIFKRDIMKDYINMLTNNSQGAKASIDMFDVSLVDNNQEKIELLQGISGTRTAAFIFDQRPYMDKGEYMKNLLNEGKCTIRYQVMRRVRVIEIVSNIEQTGYVIPLLIFNRMKYDYESIAVGKQEGGVKDIKLQSRNTGEPNCLNIYSDVVAMDSSTVPFVGRMTCQILAEFLVSNPISQEVYMCFRSSHFAITDKFGRSAGIKYLPAISQALYIVATSRLNKLYTLMDSVAGVKIPVSAQVFPSGRFDTGAQHTVVLDIISEMAWDDMPNMESKPILERRLFGDDSYMIMKFGGNVDYTYANKFIKQMDKYLLYFGYKVEVMTSFYFADFLQQSAFCGMLVPKRPRASVFTDERGDTRERHPIEQIEVMSNVVLTSAQRCREPRNIVPLVRQIWQTLRTLRLSGEITGRYNKRVRRMNDGNKYIQLPYEYPHVSKLCVPSPNFMYNKNELLPRTSRIKLIGDARYPWIYSHMLTEEEFEKLEVVEYNQGQMLEPLSPEDILLPKLERSGIIDSLILSEFNVTNQLSNMRKQQLGNELSRMANVLSRGYDEYKLYTSMNAYKALIDYGIGIPKGLVYGFEPIRRVTQLFEKEAIKSREIMKMNQLFEGFLNFNGVKIPINITKKINQLSVRCEFTFDKLIELYPTTVPLHIIPGYNDENSEFNLVSRLSSSPFSKPVNRHILINMSNKYGGKFDLESAVRIGSYLWHLDQKLLTLFMQAIDIPNQMREEFQTMIENNLMHNFIDAYNVSLQPDSNFGLSYPSPNVCCEVENGDVLKGMLQGLLQQIGTDYFMTMAHNSGRRKVIVRPSLYTVRSFTRKYGSRN